MLESIVLTFYKVTYMYNIIPVKTVDEEQKQHLLNNGYEEITINELCERENYSEEYKTELVRKYFAINIHMLLSDETYDMVLETIADMKNDPRLAKMNAIVFLSLKPKGRGVKYNSLTMAQFKSVIDFSLESGINFGFDSCSANKFLATVKDSPNFKQYETNAEPCESSLFSTYIDVQGKFFPCSFSPDTDLWGSEGIDVANCEDFMKDVWYNERTNEFRKSLLGNHRSCPLFKI